MTRNSLAGALVLPLLSLMLAVHSPLARAEAPKCAFTLDPSSVTVGWTAYKTSQKTAVNGSFKKIDVHGKTGNESLAHLLEGLKVTVDKLSLDTGNPARDKTLADFFFSKLHASVSGKIKKFSEKDKAFTLALELNGKKKDVPMHYEVQNDLAFEATGNLDLLDFGAKDALDSLHEQCSDLHKGADGVSKTWSEVALKLKGNIAKSCQ